MSIHYSIPVPKEIRQQIDAELAVSEAESENYFETSQIRADLGTQQGIFQPRWGGRIKDVNNGE